MTHADTIQELKERFPYGPIYRAPRITNVEDWILQRGIEAGREEVIVYLAALWGVIESPEEELPYVRSPQNRISADQYCSSPASPYPESGSGLP